MLSLDQQHAVQLQPVEEHTALDFRPDNVAIHFIAQIGMWREQCFSPESSDESAEIECTNLFSGLVTTKSSDRNRANIFGSLQ